ncbi:MAG: diguanylate cyclase [Pseudomonadota bacterium]
MESPDSDAAYGKATGELARLQANVTATRALLTRLTQDVAQTKRRAANGEAARLVEANEQLVVSALRAQTQAEVAERSLTEVSAAAKLDVLTGLPNRMLLLDRFAVAIANATRHRTRLALLFLDLNNFKLINDRFGHAVGDQVLKRAATSLAASVRAGDTVSRHGGDEFLVLLAEVAHASDAILVADKMIADLGAPSYIGEHLIRLTVGIGVSIYPDDGQDADSLIACADKAMYRAKKQGIGSFIFYGEESVSERTLQLPALVLPLQETDHATARADHEHRHALLQEANQQLILAALDSLEQQDAAEHAQRQQTQFLATMANALRNPLQPLRAATAMLGPFRDDESLQPRVQAMIELQVGNMSRLVDKLVDMAHPAAKVSPDDRAVAMGPVIENAVNACRPLMLERLQHLQIVLPADSVEAQGESVQLTQVLRNLLDNATKYTPNGGRIELSLGEAGDTVVIKVSDSGIGISAEALPGIFGQGAGLRAVRQLVEAQGGTVAANSGGKERGSQFTVTLRLTGKPSGAIDLAL